MSKVRKFVEQVESQADLGVSTIIVDTEAALAVKNVAKNLLEGAAKGGRNSKGRIKSNSPRAVKKREYMRKRRKEEADLDSSESES